MSLECPYVNYSRGLLQLGPGDTVLLPGGWPHAVVTTHDSLVIGGNFLHRYNFRLQLEVWRVEDYLGVKPKFRFPNFRVLMWYTAQYFHMLLKNIQSIDIVEHMQLITSVNIESTPKKTDAMGQTGEIDRREGLDAVSSASKNGGLQMKLRPRKPKTQAWKISPTSGETVKRTMLALWRREVEGLPLLLFMLSHWLVAYPEDDIPESIESPRVWVIVCLGHSTVFGFGII